MSANTPTGQVISADMSNRPVLRFLGRTDVAHYLGMKSIRSLAKVKLPPHDAEIGERKGWTPATIDDWKAQRPGRGRRPRKHEQ